MLIVFIIHWMLFAISQTSAKNKSTTESSVGKTSPLRRQWPEIKFEDFYQNSGEGPMDENMTESYAWVTIVTQIKASIWPTITRIKISTAIPKPIQVSSSPLFSSELFSWGSSFGYAISSNSYSFIETNLFRSSIIYLGPSSSIKFSARTASSDIISNSQLPSDLMTNTTSSQSYVSTKSVTHSNRLSEYFSSDEYNSLSTFQIESDRQSTPQIHSSLVSPENELKRHTETPFLESMSFAMDKNSIYRTSLSLSRSYPESMSSTPTRVIFSIESSVHYTRMTASTIRPHSQSVIITTSKTIDTLFTSKLSQILSSRLTPTPTSTPLCPEVLQTVVPKAHTLEKPFENYLIRTVLNNTSNETIANIKTRIEGNIRQIYIHAFGKQYEEIDNNIRKGRKLQSKHINSSIDVKLWDISVKNGSQQIHVIYYVEKDGTLIPYEDAFRTLSYITDDKYSEMIGFDVIEKVKPYNEKLVSKTEINWLGIILISCSGLLLIICLIAGLAVLYKYRSEKRKWIDSFHMELNRVVPDNQIHWRTVSHHFEPKSNTSVKEVSDESEFEYMPFRSLHRNSEPTKKITLSKGIQSNLEMRKEKVVPIAKIIDDNNSDGIDLTKTTFVTIKDINDINANEENSIPRIIEVQMSEQTQSIIRAIRNELTKFDNNSMSFSAQESIISDSSEA